MKTVKTIKEAREVIKEWKNKGLSIGLVPTRGYLHEGQKSLIEKAATENDKVVVSIFINAVNFGPKEERHTYPMNIEQDKKLCESGGANLVFNPEPTEIYFNDISTYVNEEYLTQVLCGGRRIGHFKAVCTIVSKLLNIITPNKIYFGQKGAQQLAVVKRMVRDLNFDVEVIGCPIIREKAGLAISSRNMYLSKQERESALILNKSLKKAKELLNKGERRAIIIKDAIRKEINKDQIAKIDYVAIIDKENLEAVERIQKSVIIAIAVYIGNIRLLDNFVFTI